MREKRLGSCLVPWGDGRGLGLSFEETGFGFLDQGFRDSGLSAGGLTDMGWCRFNEAVIGRGLLVFLAAVTLASWAKAAGGGTRQRLPLELARSAAAAVDAMGVELAKGRVAVTLERMYGPWKDRAARRLGGMDKLVEVVVERRDRMQANGMQSVSYTHLRAHET